MTDYSTGAICIYNELNHDIRQFTLTQATPTAVDVWLAQLGEIYAEFAHRADHEPVRLILDLTLCGNLPLTYATPAMRRWLQNHRITRAVYLAVLHDDHLLIEMTSSFLKLAGLAEDHRFFHQSHLNDAIEWLAKTV